jgi:hypothetical protein
MIYAPGEYIATKERQVFKNCFTMGYPLVRLCSIGTISCNFISILTVFRSGTCGYWINCNVVMTPSTSPRSSCGSIYGSVRLQFLHLVPELERLLSSALQELTSSARVRNRYLWYLG